MDHAVLRGAVMDYFRAELQKGKERRDTLGPFSEEEKEQARVSIGLLEQGNAAYWKMMGKDHALEQLSKFFAATGLPRAEYADHQPAVLDNLRLGMIGAYKEVLAYGETLGVYDFSEPASAEGDQSAGDAAQRLSGLAGDPVVVPIAGSAPPETKSGPLLSEIFAQRADEANRTDAWSIKLSNDYRSWTELFIEVAGDRPIGDYRKADAREFKDILLKLPANRDKNIATARVPIREAANRAVQMDIAPMATSTVNKGIGRMQATWRWADQQLDDPVPDIFGPMKVRANGSGRDDTDPFSPEQLHVLFHSPLYTGCRSERFRADPGETYMGHTSWFWLPLLALFTGARLNELCQLGVDDVREERGIPFLRIHEGAETQRIKGHKQKIVPLHPELIRLGFTCYVASQRSNNETRVFPTLTLDRSGYYSDRSSKDFNAYIKRIGIKTPKTKFHSFRHNFKDILRHSGVPHDINDILLGHTLGGMAARYGKGDAPIPLLHEAVSKVRYPGLSLEHIQPYE